MARNRRLTESNFCFSNLKIHFQPVDPGPEILDAPRLLLPNGLRASRDPARRRDAFPASEDEDVPVVDVDRLRRRFVGQARSAILRVLEDGREPGPVSALEQELIGSRGPLAGRRHPSLAKGSIQFFPPLLLRIAAPVGNVLGDDRFELFGAGVLVAAFLAKSAHPLVDEVRHGAFIAPAHIES
jgi:hypothetical protein